jgi:hypothetical protein
MSITNNSYLENETVSLSYIREKLYLKDCTISDELLKKAIFNSIDKCCRDNDNNYTGTKRLLLIPFNGISDIMRIKKYILQ